VNNGTLYEVRFSRAVCFKAGLIKTDFTLQWMKVYVQTNRSEDCQQIATYHLNCVSANNVPEFAKLKAKQGHLHNTSVQFNSSHSFCLFGITSVSTVRSFSDVVILLCVCVCNY
jgi:hypothetical protein